MEKETKKIAWACFIGGAFCGATAFLLAPMFWWLGILAGLAGGYFGYEFRLVLRAVPQAWQAARVSDKMKDKLQNCVKFWSETIDEATDMISKYLRKPHPLGYLSLPVAIAATVLLWPSLQYFEKVSAFLLLWIFLWALLIILIVAIVPLESVIQKEMFTRSVRMFLQGTIIFILSVLFSLPLVVSGVAIVWQISFILIGAIAMIGARFSQEKCFWMPPVDSESQRQRFIVLADADGLVEEELNYRNAFRWVAKGAGIILLFFIYTMWKYLLIGIKYMVIFMGKFLKNFFILVHSSEKHKRIFCAITGTVGGMAAFLMLSPSVETLAAKVMVVIFGGLLGAAFGVIMRELSLRWLPLAASA